MTSYTNTVGSIVATITTCNIYRERERYIYIYTHTGDVGRISAMNSIRECPAPPHPKGSNVDPRGEVDHPGAEEGSIDQLPRCLGVKTPAKHSNFRFNMCVYIYITHIHVYTNMCSYIYIYVYTDTYLRICVLIYIWCCLLCVSAFGLKSLDNYQHDQSDVEVFEVSDIIAMFGIWDHKNGNYYDYCL